eukprot:1137932-Alexandrium_andersonii.AAC.1
MAIDSLLFRTRAARSQADSARLGASHLGAPLRALCSAAIAMPPKRSGQSPEGGRQVAGGGKPRRGRASAPALSEPGEDNRRSSPGSRSLSSRPGAPVAKSPAQAASPAV